MDLNDILAGHQVALMRAAATGCTTSREAFLDEAKGFIDHLAAIQLGSDATLRLMSA